MFRTFSTTGGNVVVNTKHIMTAQADESGDGTIITMIGGLAFVSNVPFVYIRMELDPDFKGNRDADS